MRRAREWRGAGRGGGGAGRGGRGKGGCGRWGAGTGRGRISGERGDRGARGRGIERRARDAAETGGGGQTPPARLLLNDSGAGCGAGWETGSGSALAPSARAPPGRPGRTARASTSFATGSSGYSGHPCRAGRPRPSPPRSTSISTASIPAPTWTSRVSDFGIRPRDHVPTTPPPRAFPRARDPRGGRLAPRVRPRPASDSGSGNGDPGPRDPRGHNPGPARPVGR